MTFEHVNNMTPEMMFLHELHKDQQFHHLAKTNKQTKQMRQKCTDNAALNIQENNAATNNITL